MPFFYQVCDHQAGTGGRVQQILHVPLPVRAPPRHPLQQLRPRQCRHVDDAGRVGLMPWRLSTHLGVVSAATSVKDYLDCR